MLGYMYFCSPAKFVKVPAIKKIVVILMCVCGIAVQAQDPNAYKKGTVKHRLSIAPVASFYKNHPQHTTNTKGKRGFSAAYKAELLLGRRINLLLGLEHMNQNVTFQGYYSAPGATYLFDKTYAYTHEIRMKEVQVPFGFKRSFNNEKDSKYSTYFSGGVGARYMYGSYYVISNDSTENVVYDGKGNLEFEHQVLTQLLNGNGKSFTKRFNTFIFCGLGVQYNFRDSGKGLFFEVGYKYGISRMHYSGYQNSNSLNIKDAQLLYNFGFKF